VILDLVSVSEQFLNGTSAHSRIFSAIKLFSGKMIVKMVYLHHMWKMVGNDNVHKYISLIMM